MQKLTVTTTSFATQPIKMLNEAGFTVIQNSYGRKLTPEETVALCKDAIGIIAGTEILDTEILNQLKGLRVISRCGTGLDNVDMKQAASLGIKVFNTPDGPTLAVAELTVGLIIDLLRRISQMDRDVRIGKWHKTMGNLLQGKRIGIVGFGRIGQKVVSLLVPFGVKPAYFDIRGITTDTAISMEFNEILGWADVLSLHLSTRKGNNPIIGAKEFTKMKRGMFLVNLSRGGTVDEEALRAALDDGIVAGAACDVFNKEPYSGPLTLYDNVVLTPHVGSYAMEARMQMESQAVENLLKGLEVI